MVAIADPTRPPPNTIIFAICSYLNAPNLQAYLRKAYIFQLQHHVVECCLVDGQGY